jgi:hypothetical protein
MRIACALVPRFALAVELLERPDLRDQPLVIGGAPEDRKVVVECSPEAEREGVRHGMALREARARCRNAAFLEAHPALYRESYGRMLDALESISPLVEESDLGCAYVGLEGLSDEIDARQSDAGPALDAHAGVRRLFRTEDALAGAMLTAVADALRLPVRLGVAESRFVAWAAARDAAAGRARVVAPGEAASFLAPLPVHYLPLPEEVVRRLHWLGLHRVDDLARLRRDLAHGEDRAPLLSRRHATEMSDQIAFEQPVADVQTVLIAARYLITRLLNRPECRGRFVRGLLLSVALSNGHRWERVVTFREPMADQQRMHRALAAKVDGVAFPSAIEAVTLVLRDLCGETGVQSSLFTTRARHLQELQDELGQLRARVGHASVMKIVGVEPWSRVPERRYGLIDYEPSTSLSR